MLFTSLQKFNGVKANTLLPAKRSFLFDCMEKFEERRIDLTVRNEREGGREGREREKGNENGAERILD